MSTRIAHRARAHRARARRQRLHQRLVHTATYWSNKYGVPPAYQARQALNHQASIIRTPNGISVPYQL